MCLIIIAFICTSLENLGKFAEFPAHFQRFTETATRGDRRSSLHSGTYGTFQDGYLIGCNHVGYVYATYTR